MTRIFVEMDTRLSSVSKKINETHSILMEDYEDKQYERSRSLKETDMDVAPKSARPIRVTSLDKP